MTDQEKNEAINKNNATEKGFNCCGFENMPDMMKKMFSDEKNQIDYQKVMPKMCDCMSGNPQKK